MFSALLEMLVLVTALSLDAFVAAFAYGTDRVKIPVSSVFVLAFLSAGILMVSLLAGNGIGNLLPEAFTDMVCFLILFLLGLIKLFDSSLKAFLRKLEPAGRKLCFSLAGARIILNIYADPEKANEEDKSILSPREALSLGLALSLDSGAAGLGAGVLNPHVAELFFLSFFFGLLVVPAGNYLGNRLAKKRELNLSFLSGALLIILAVRKLL